MEQVTLQNAKAKRRKTFSPLRTLCFCANNLSRSTRRGALFDISQVAQLINHSPGVQNTTRNIRDENIARGRIHPPASLFLWLSFSIFLARLFCHQQTHHQVPSVTAT